MRLIAGLAAAAAPPVLGDDPELADGESAADSTMNFMKSRRAT
jgi:hypothetical protein